MPPASEFELTHFFPHVGTWLRKRNGGHKWINGKMITIGVSTSVLPDLFVFCSSLEKCSFQSYSDSPISFNPCVEVYKKFLLLGKEY